MNKKSKVILWTAILAVIVIAIVVVKLVGHSANKEQVVFETGYVQNGNIASSVTATGTVEPVTEVEVGTQVSGIIDKIYVDYNTVVKKGEIIAEMDRVTLTATLQSSQANYDGCKAELDYQEKTFNRTKALYEKELVSEEDYDEAEYNYLRAKSSLESARADLATAERNLSYATITSPIDGVVIERSVEEGQTVAAGFETPTLFYIAADLTKMQVVADVDEADIGGVEEGQRCSFTVDAYPDDVFEGYVEQVRLGSSEEDADATVITYEVVISADNPDLKLLPRLTANIEIYTIDKQNVLCAPAKALRFSMNEELGGPDAVINDCDGENKVWTKSGNVFTAHSVEIGISNGNTTEIVSGIAAGTEVVTGVNITTKAQTKAATAEKSAFSMGGPPNHDDEEGEEE